MESDLELRSKYLKHDVKLDSLDLDTDWWKLAAQEHELFVIDTTTEAEPDQALKKKEKKEKKKAKNQIYSTTIQIPGPPLKGYFNACSSQKEIDRMLDRLSLAAEGSALEAHQVIKPGITEKGASLPPYRVSRRQRKKANRAERESTAGANWFHLPAPETSAEAKRDLQLIKARNVLDPKRFYKKSDYAKTGLPKYYMRGTVIDSPTEFYSGRLVKKDRKRTLVEELLADAAFKQHAKKKYTEALLHNPRLSRKDRKKKLIASGAAARQQQRRRPAKKRSFE